MPMPPSPGGDRRVERFRGVRARGVPPPDVALVARGGHEVGVHAVVLAAQSPRLYQLLAGGTRRFEVQHPPRVVTAFVAFLYMEGPSAFEGLLPSEALGLLKMGQELEVESLEARHVEALVHPPEPPPGSKRQRLRETAAQKSLPPGQSAPLAEKAAPPLGPDCAQGAAGGPSLRDMAEALLHDHLEEHPKLLEGVCRSVGRCFLEALDVARPQLLALPLGTLMRLLRVAVCHVFTGEEAGRVLQLCAEHAKASSICDLLRETKSWPWGSEAASELRASAEEAHGPAEWEAAGVRGMLESSEGAPPRLVDGQLFDWHVRLDFGPSSHLRIVYDGAVPDAEDEAGSEPSGRQPLAFRFPAATFAWHVVFRGQQVFHEKPVFICFPGNVPIHWSTTLPVAMQELDPSDSLRLSVSVAENPLLSLILAYFSVDLRAALASEDIFNSLPHIEYRCISAYSMVASNSLSKVAEEAPEPA